MEKELLAHLLTLGERFSAVRGLKESTIGRMCAADGSFFARLREGNTITVRKYDAVVDWFETNWPEGEPMPRRIITPEKLDETFSGKTPEAAR